MGLMPKPVARAIRSVRDRFDRNPNRAVPAVLRDEAKIVRWISELTGEPHSTVRRRLREEYDHFGINVSRAMAEAGLEPYVWSDDLIKFYEQTDAFLYELVTWNLNRLKALMRRFVARMLKSDGPGPYDVLSIGDGLGVDSAHLAARGHRVTYHEVSGYTEAFARRVFKDCGVDVRIVVDESELPAEGFDAVICLDVLEHVPDPPAMVRRMVGYLRPGGRLLVHSPFMWIHHSNPTHLRASRRYSGSLDLYRQAGLTLVDGTPAWSPLSLRKADTPGKARRGAALNRMIIRCVGAGMTTGRLVTFPFLWGDDLRLIEARWFPNPAKEPEAAPVTTVCERWR